MIAVPIGTGTASPSALRIVSALEDDRPDEGLSLSRGIPLGEVEPIRADVSAPDQVRLTPGQLRVLHRNILVKVAHKAGIPHRWLADVLGLEPGRIESIVRMKLYTWECSTRSS
jgi:hypothetical protein